MTKQQYVGVHARGFVWGHPTREEAFNAVKVDAEKYDLTQGLLYEVPVAPDTKPTMENYLFPMDEGTQVVKRLDFRRGVEQVTEFIPPEIPDPPKAPSSAPNRSRHEMREAPESSERTRIADEMIDQAMGDESDETPAKEEPAPVAKQEVHETPAKAEPPKFEDKPAETKRSPVKAGNGPLAGLF